jgi:hypothetical protein
LTKTFLFLALATLIGSASVFGALNLQITSAYASQVIEGHRVVVEESSNLTKVRYEKILRNGYDEVVKVVAPDFFEWAYLNGKTYVVFGNEMKRSPASVIDSERLFMKCLSSTPTILSTSVVNYNGKKAYRIEVKDKSATYVGIFLAPSLLLTKLEVQHKNGKINVTYDAIQQVPPLYFKKVIDSFKIVNTPPSTMEVEVWKMIYHLNDVSVTSIKVNDVSIVLVHGVASNLGEMVVYLVKKGDRISTTNLASQFKSKGFSLMKAEQNGISMLFVSNTKDPQKLKEWVTHVLKSSSF